MKQFVLVGGMPRSGTTLLETVIGSHSRIAMPPGDYPFAEQYAKGLSVEKIFSILSTKSTWELWNIKDFSSLVDQDHGNAFHRSLTQYATANNKVIPAAKAPYSEFFWETYQNWLSDFDLKFIQAIRNPFDVMASLKHSHIHKNWQVFRDTLEVQSKNWKRSATIGSARQVLNPESYRLIKYEDFVKNPASCTQEFCSFLGVEYEEDRMLGRADYAYHSTNTSFPDEDTKKEAKTAYIYRPTNRKSFLDDAEIALIANICGETARSLGYDDKEFHCSPPEYANKLKTAVRVRRSVSRLTRKLFG